MQNDAENNSKSPLACVAPTATQQGEGGPASPALPPGSPNPAEQAAAPSSGSSALLSAALEGVSGAGAVGQASAGVRACVLARVPTQDSVSTYGTPSAALLAPSAHATVHVRAKALMLATRNAISVTEEPRMHGTF